jgi:hypothetical protein
MPQKKKKARRARKISTSAHFARGYFGLGENDHVVHVTANADYLLHVWARNVDTSQGGIQILTPPSQFRGVGSTGSHDGLVLNVGGQTGVNLGCVGAQGGEVIDITSSAGSRVSVFLSVETAAGATVKMTRG